MNKEILKLWPELEWIKDQELKEKTARTWGIAPERSVLTGKYLRHPFSGVSLAEECGLPPEVCHIIAAHAGEGDHVKRTTEAYVVHHADFMTFLPFKSRLVV